MSNQIKNFRFAELNLRHNGNTSNTLDLVNRAIRMGYDSVAINIDIGDPFQTLAERIDEGSEEPAKKKKKKQKSFQDEEEIIPDPFRIDEDKLNPTDLQRLKSDGKVFRQFTRITMTLSNTTAVHKIMNNKKIKKFDLIAVRIQDQEMLTTMSRKGDFVDIITFDPCAGQKPSWLYSSKLVQAVASEGISFELTYSGGLTDSPSRREFLSSARLLMDATKKGGNVFLSSGARSLIQIRGPYDVSNLSSLFGMDPFYGIHFVSNDPKNILLRCQARRLTIKGGIHVSDLDHVPNRTKSSSEALEDLLKVDEFRKQVKLQDEENAQRMEVDS
ncbi:hypothetical protein FO519_005576 [Halicephalobus sp. NKZ332]|nr:hypothetical protein FO519_005576 [Halicephalobus sp. NKZ332]